MDENSPEEAGAEHDASAPGVGAAAGVPRGSSSSAQPVEPSLRWEVRQPPRGEGVSPGLAAVLPLPEAEDVAGRPVLEQLAATVRLVEAAASLALWPLSEDELGVSLRLMARLTGAVDRCQVAVVGEAHARGAGTTSGRSTVDWVVCESAGRIPAARAAQLLRVARCAQQTGLPPSTDPSSDDVGSERPEGGWESVYGAFISGELPLDKADRIGRFQRDVRPIASEDDIAADVKILVAAACDNERGLGLTGAELTRAITVAGQYLKPAALLEKGEAAARAARALYRSDGPAGMSTYRVLMDPEGAAVIDAAVAAFSFPVKSADGERDPRPAATRRADALLQVLQHGIAAGTPPPPAPPAAGPNTGSSGSTADTADCGSPSSPGSPGSPAYGPRGEKAQIIVTIDYAQLQEIVRGAGLTTTGQVLSPATIRRLACEAGILPMVLGADSAPLDVGRAQRLFTGPLRKAILRRDTTCTWAGCTLPGAWCHVHHNDWWSRGGPTSLLNGATLCPRHHTLVHERNLTATITATTVTWPT